jgi:tyrosinase
VTVYVSLTTKRGQWTVWNETKRSPVSVLENAYSQNSRVAKNCDAILAQQQQKLYLLYTSYSDYGSFSTKAWTSTTNNSAYESVEAIHDQIHVAVGDSGHMNYTPQSAFDPIFFLHHAFVDKVFAWWQILYPNAWVPTTRMVTATYTIAKNDVVNGQSNLTPFYSDYSGNFWTSDKVRSTLSFGYTYEEPPFSGGQRSKDDRRAQLVAHINKMYGPTSTMGMAKRHNRRGVSGYRKGVKSVFRDDGVPDLSRHSALNDRPIAPIMNGNHYTEWLANVHVKMQALDGPFTVCFFIGKVPEKTEDWNSAVNLVGSMGVFAGQGRPNNNNQISSTVHLTPALMKMMAAGYMEDLDATEVCKFLEHFLRVRVVKADKTEVPVDEVDGLSVKIATSQVKAPASETEFPQWGPVINRFDLLEH